MRPVSQRLQTDLTENFTQSSEKKKKNDLANIINFGHLLESDETTYYIAKYKIIDLYIKFCIYRNIYICHFSMI